jgi:myo-inositol 2-dehydrogenase / D-chiro-inositol 1-dehydrogenase
MTERVRVALVGAGRIGQRHAATLASAIPRAELAIIADVHGPSAEALATKVRCPRWTDDPGAVLADRTIDAIVIASSTDSHAPLIVAAAEAGKQLFCEKPIALDLEATDRALDAVERGGVRLQMGFQRRFDKAYHQAKELIVSGALGRIEAIRDTMRDPSPAPRSYLETSGGLYRDMTIHNFDCVRWMMGQEVKELFAMGSALVSPVFQELGDIDTSVISLRFGDDSLGVIDNSRRSGFGYDVRTEVFGSEGALMIGYSRDTPMLRLDGNGVHSDHIYWFLERFDQAYIDELKIFVDCIVDGTQPPVDGHDARAAMALAYAAEASLRENAPVSPSRFARTGGDGGDRVSG